MGRVKLSCDSCPNTTYAREGQAGSVCKNCREGRLRKADG